MFPADATVVLSLDFRRIRTTRVWRELATLAGEDPKDKELVDGLRTAVGFDPFQQIHRVVAAFPEEARKSGRFAVIVEGDRVDRGKLLGYLRDEARRRGSDVIEQQHAGRTLWKSPRPDGPSGFFLDDGRFVLGAGGWTEAMAAASTPAPAGAPAPAPKVNPALARLTERVARGRSIWLAALVPEATRAALMANPRFGQDAAIMRFGVGVDLGPGLAGDLVAELSNQADARALASKVTGFVEAAKKSPEVLLLGVAPYLEHVKAEADGPDARVRLELPAAQTDELVGRLVGLLRMRRGGR